MKLLFDQNISFRVVRQICNYFPQAKHVRDFELQFASDREIWKYAKDNEYNIVTLDSDFYDIVTLNGHPPKIIWLRLGNTSSLNLARVFSEHQENIKSFITDIHYRDIGCLEINK